MSLPQFKEDKEEDKENDPPEQIETRELGKPVDLEQEGEEEVVLVPIKASSFSSSPEKKKSPEKKA